MHLSLHSREAAIYYTAYIAFCLAEIFFSSHQFSLALPALFGAA
jgi:hypothetical protein